MNTENKTLAGALSILKTVALYLKSKMFSIVVLALLAWAYVSLPSGEDNKVPFAEVLYAGVLVTAIMVLGPLMRLVVFREAALFAEDGSLDAALKSGKFTSALAHYWFATAISYVTPLLCVSSLLSL